MHTVCTVSDSGMYYHNTTAQLASESGFDRHVGEGDHDLLNQHFLLPDLVTPSWQRTPLHTKCWAGSYKLSHSQVTRSRNTTDCIA